MDWRAFIRSKRLSIILGDSKEFCRDCVGVMNILEEIYSSDLGDKDFEEEI